MIKVMRSAIIFGEEEFIDASLLVFEEDRYRQFVLISELMY